ncbi:hypothetical protein ZWY2020_029531 [Hordeum vulgare]|nr:hypothetical protein ZWY2020_029531 [Hordeum vulgare]
MDGQGALESLLGRLTTILVDEARLLGGLHGDVEFIKEEMECMNGVLLHLAEAQHLDRHVRAWMKQVVCLARHCEGNVELYIHIVTDAGHHESGPLGYLRHIIRYVRTIPERHRIATRIRELKVKAHDLGHRQLRYGITVPPAAGQDGEMFMNEDVQAPDGPEAEEEDARRRALLVRCSWSEDKEAYEQKILDETIKSVFCECEEGAVEELENRESHPRIFMISCNEIDLYREILWADLNFRIRIAKKLYEQEISSFSCKAWVNTDEFEFYSVVVLLRKILQQVAPHPAEQEDVLRVEAQESTETSLGDDKEDEAMQLTNKLEGFLKGKRSLIILANVSSQRWDNISNTKKLVSSSCDGEHSMRTGKTQLDNFKETLKGCRDANKSVGKQMVKISYNDLPAKYRSCLLYLTIFPESDPIRRTTVCRRWIAEGLITSRENRAEDEADSCFDALLSRALIQPVEIGDTGKIKTFTLHRIVREVINRIARDVNFVDTDLPPDLARHLPVHSRTGVQLQPSRADRSVEAADSNGIVAFLPYLAKSSQWQLMKMLDLEGCRGLKKQHLKSICKIILLKYLSLRNTDITKLPKQIEKLQCLETLDIRQTAVRAFTTRSIMLPVLKHLLSGPKGSSRNSSDGSQDLIMAVRLPRGIKGMEKLETLSHVEAPGNVNDLTDVGHLLRLRKLGVILSAEKGFAQYLCGSGLTFNDGEFKNLKSFVVTDDVISNITFDTGATPRLETIVWSFAKMESISGVRLLDKLKKLELNGDCDPDIVKQVYEELPDNVDFKHKPGRGHQEDGATVAASISVSN